MKRDQLGSILQQARADIAATSAASRLIQLTSIIGTWVAACALFGFVAFELITSTRMVEPGAFQIMAIGMGMMAGALFILRRVDALSFPAHGAAAVLAAGIACTTFAALDRMEAVCAAALLLCLAQVYFLRSSWQRVMFGAMAAGSFGAWYMLSFDDALTRMGSGAHIALLLWLCAFVAIRKTLLNGKPHWAEGWDMAANGWGAVTLIMLALSADWSMLAGVSELPSFFISRLVNKDGVWSPLLALAAIGLLAYSWPALRRSWMVMLAVATAALACFVPNLGAAFLVLAVCCATARWSMAIAAAFVAAWAVGACYYALQWTLLEKAALFAGTGAAMLTAAWMASREVDAGAMTPDVIWLPRMLVAPAPVAKPLPAPALVSLLGLCFGSVLCFANLSIWQNEQRINQGTQIFVRLAPVDPRSLMQGDYMRLGFDLGGIDCGGIGPTACQIVMQRDGKGVAKAVRKFMQGEKLAEREIVVTLAPQHGDWSMPTDAWYFTEGEAARYSGAQYGEFRVYEGRAILVGMRGESLKEL